MKHAIFIGEYELTIDEKHRVLCPSGVRKVMDPERDGKGFYIIIGQNRKVWLYAARYYEEALHREEQGLTPKEEIQPDPATLAAWQRTFGGAHCIEWDAQGRILLPESTLRRTGTQREITLVGVRNHLEVWNRDDWEVHYNELLAAT